MVAEFIDWVSRNFVILSLVHIIVSAVTAYFLSKYSKKRFVVNTKKVRDADSLRLLPIEEGLMITKDSLKNSLKISWKNSIKIFFLFIHQSLFKLLFQFSLHKHNYKTNMLFMFLFNFTIPMFGVLASIWISWYIMNVTYSKKVENTNILNLDEFGMAFLKVERMFGEGSMSDLMTSEYAPKSKKLMALSSLSANLSPANLKIIKNTLFSTDDEIRMFGYAIINKAEQKLSAKMNTHLEIFNEEDEKEEDDPDLDFERRAYAAKELGFLYWEMVYIELAHDSLKDNFLDEVIRYTTIAKEFYTDEVNVIYEKIVKYELKLAEIKLEENPIEYYKRHDTLEMEKRRYDNFNDISTRLYVLMGRVYMYKNDLEKAVIEFTIAQDIDTSEASFSLPYLAEVNFLMGNYDVVHLIMKQAKDLEFNATLYPISQQWRVV